MQGHETWAVNKVNNLLTYISTEMQIYRFICSYYVIILSVQYQWHRKWLMDAFSFRKACGEPQGGNGRDIQSQWAFWPSTWSSTQSCHLSQPLSANPDLLFLFSVHLVFLRVQAFVPSCRFLSTEILQTSLICSPSCLVVHASWHPPSSSLSHALLSTMGLKVVMIIIIYYSVASVLLWTASLPLSSM